MNGFSLIAKEMLLLEASAYIKLHLDWFLINGYISHIIGSSLEKYFNDKIKLLSYYAEDICFGFNIPKDSLIAPIYTGYQEYYSVDKTNGEHYSRQRPKF